MSRSYFLPRDEADARQAVSDLKDIFGKDAVRSRPIKHGYGWNKAKATGISDLHDDADSSIYLGLLKAKRLTPFA